MNEGPIYDNIGLNALPTRLTKGVFMMGLKVDPLTNGFTETHSSFSVRPSTMKGVQFIVGDTVIPYNPETLTAIDGLFGRMLRVSDTSGAQILIVEHLLSAIRLLGLSDIEIHIGESCRAPVMSSGIPKIGFNQPTYCIPVCGPGVSGYIKQLSPYCEFTGEEPEEYIIHSPNDFSHTEELQGKYKGLVRRFTVVPDDHFRIEVESAHQPDIKKNNPIAKPFVISDQDDVQPHLNARPIMRLTSRTAAMIVWILNFRSYALTSKTYFKSRPQLSREEVVSRMQQKYQENENEHLVHTAIADLLAELGAHIGNKRFLGKIILKDTNHVFRLLALRAVLEKNETR